MKTKDKVLLALTLLITTLSFGQQPSENPKFGADSASRMECVKNLSLYREFVKQKNYIDAMTPWKLTFTICPKATENIYIDGVKILNFFIKKEKDPSKKNELIDSLMLVYDQRIKYYNKEGNVLGRKASDLLRYRPEKYEEAYSYLERSTEIQKKKTDAVVLFLLMQTSKMKYSAGKIDKDKVVENFTKSIDILDYQLKNNSKKKAKIEKAKENIEKVFLSLEGVATCEAVVTFYQPKFDETPQDIDLLKSITKILDKMNCTTENLYYSAAENLHNLEPSALSAYTVGKMFKGKGDYKKAATYYKQASDLQEDNVEKAKYYIELGDLTNRHLNNPSLARSYAFKAIETDNTNGHAYLLIGNIYATCKNCGENDFQKKAIYWLAVDKYAKAKKVDPSLTDDANKLISLYTQHFPDNETIFFHGFNEGDIYTVECWINETTKIRSR